MNEENLGYLAVSIYCAISILAVLAIIIDSLL